MPLPVPAPRKKFHNRAINCEGFAREDGLWDIEARITDTKTYPFDNEWRGGIEPGDPIHDMWIRLTMDDDRVITGVETAMDGTPFETCLGAAPNFKALVGVKIAPGWNLAVRKRVGGPAGCTHMVELLAVMATVAYQTIGPGKVRRDEWLGRDAKDDPKSDLTQGAGLLDTCYAWARTSPVVKRYLPDRYEEPEE